LSNFVHIELVTKENNEKNKNENKNNSFVGKKIQRNSLCPCGSGKKYKFCHGA